MNYHILEVSELKQEARQRRIKLYYVMKKAQLIQLLCMPELPQKYIIEKKTILQLREEAKKRNFPCIYKMNRHMLVELLYPTSEENDKNNDSTKKHNNPKSHDTK